MIKYTVKDGDTLGGIAQYLAEDNGQKPSISYLNRVISSLQATNHLNGTMIYPGQKLNISEDDVGITTKVKSPVSLTEKHSASLHVSPSFVRAAHGARIARKPSVQEQQTLNEPESTNARTPFTRAVHRTDDNVLALSRYKPRDLQKCFAKLGYNLGHTGPKHDGVDNDWGRLSEGAASTWQRQNGYEDNGKITIAQFKELRTQALASESELKIGKAAKQNPFSSFEKEIIRNNIINNAKQYLGQTEKGSNNHGPLVKKFLNAVGLPEGYAWCAAMGATVLKDEIPGALPKTGRTRELLSASKERGAFRELGDYSPEKADLIFFEREKTGDGKMHFAFVEKTDQDGTIHTIEGNIGHEESPVGLDGVHRRSYSPEEFSESRIVGFADSTVLAQYSTTDFHKMASSMIARTNSNVGTAISDSGVTL